MSASVPYVRILGERKSFSLQATEDAPPQLAVPDELNPWRVIWVVGGLIWLGVTALALFWLLPWAGTHYEGEYVASTMAHGVQHFFVFLAAALAYRLAIGLGWPQSRGARLRVVLINAVLAIAVVIWADTAVALASGYIDGQFADMRDMLRLMPDFLSRADPWAAPLRFYLPPYVLGLCAIALVMTARRHQREALRSAELANAYTAARLAMLSAQLQPHFLFNSLHAIMGLVDESPRQASLMLARLGDFLRHALETSRSPWVAVATELEGLEAYLAVQEVRFSGRLNIAIEASPQALNLYVPSLLLQPLAENAIEHGRDACGPALQVRIAVTVSAERLWIAVHNSSPQLPAQLSPASYGRGLQNVALRLRAAYGEDARLSVGPDPKGGTTASLDLPVRHRGKPSESHP
jgi:hypothetical protein